MNVTIDATRRPRPLLFATPEGRIAWLQDGVLHVFSRARWAWVWVPSDPAGRYAGRVLTPDAVNVTIAVYGTPSCPRIAPLPEDATCVEED